jgi:multisubunit Na+/H+ antiporter MnhB subunit
MKRTGTLSFALFVIVALGAIYLFLHRSGRASLGLVAVLVGILVLRVVLFLVNMRQQRHNAERGKGPVKIETRLGINDEPEKPSGEPPAASPGAPRP